MNDTRTELRAFIAKMKLRELKRYRAKLHAEYDAIEAQADAASSDVERLRVLYEGLRELEVNDTRIHEDVANLDVALEAGEPDGQALAARWVERLQTVVRQGRARADAITLFGGLLGEKLDPDRATPCGDGLVQEMRELSIAPPDEVDLPRIVASLETGLIAERGEDALADLRKINERGKLWCPDPYTLEAIVQRLCGGPWFAADVRELLRDVSRVDPETLKHGAMFAEFAAALKLSWEDLDEFAPTTVKFTPIWTRNRWRVAPRMSVLDMIMVEIISDAAWAVVTRAEGRSRVNRLLRLCRLLELRAPEVIISNERRMLDETWDLRQITRPWYWSRPTETTPSVGELPVVFENAGAIAQRRMTFLREHAGAGGDGGYDGAYGAGEKIIGETVAMIGAEMKLAHALNITPVVIKTDLRHFFPTMPHALPLGLLQWLGADEQLISLVGRVLELPWDDTGQRPLRGIPLQLSLSRALSTIVVSALVGNIRQAADVLVIDLVDDLVILARDAESAARAWAALEEFVSAAGLKINLDKTGCLNGNGRDDLPKGPVRWGLMELDRDGNWQPNDAAVDEFAEISKAHIGELGALLDKVSAYAEQLQYLLAWLAPAAKLGQGHLERVRRAVTRFDRVIDGEGIPAMVRRELASRFLDDDELELELSDAWLHWPLTAGGLALPHPATRLVPLVAAREAHEAVERPEGDADELADAWGDWYRDLLELYTPKKPTNTPESAKLVEEFIARGSRVRHTEQKDLAPVWRWILATFGPDIIDHFGTYDFLDSDLVPIDVIRS